MRLPFYQVDAFTSRVFGGNPAALCPLETWLSEEQMQAIAAENNLSETAFFVAQEGEYAIRWFTPVAEVDLCGHATLAAAWLILNRLETERASVEFASCSGPLRVDKKGDLLVLDFPTRRGAQADPPPALVEGLGAAPSEVLEAPYWLAVFETEADVRALAPDFAKLKTLDRPLIVTAPGAARDVDFVSRFFAPGYDIDEDPVTGSAHCTLTPYWSEKLGKQELAARQISRRGGELTCTDAGERTWIAGQGALYLEGSIFLDG